MHACLFAALLAASECPASDRHPGAMLVPLPSEIDLSACTATLEGPLATAVDPSLTHLGDEGYELRAHQEGYRLTARTETGLFYGRQTVEQMKRLGMVPCSTIVDKPAMRMRAVMLDLARLKEKHEYYYRVIDQLSEWKINTVFLHLTDHSGCALEFKRYPRLATKYAFTQKEMRHLISYAADRHIELIPEIETWGHAKYITTVPEFADLAEDPKDPRALCTSNPRTWEVLGHLIDEVAALFPSRYIHVGCDEAAFGKCRDCSARIERDGPAALVAEHLRRAHDLVSAHGKKAMMWGDVLLAHRAAADTLPRDTIITHWDYRAQPDDEPVRFLRGKGFEVICSPAIVWGSRMILPRTDTLDNVAAFSRIAPAEGCMGMQTTVWVPQRYITDTLWFGLAYAAELSWSGPRRTRLEFASAFARSFFGLDQSSETAKALIDVHDLSMKSFDRLQDAWGYAAECSKPGAVDLKQIESDRQAALAVASQLTAMRPHVNRHTEEFDSLVLSADIRAFVEERAAAIHALSEFTRTARATVEADRPTAEASINSLISSLSALSKRGEDLTRRLEAAWDRWRYPDDPKKREGGENLLGGFYVSRQFLATMLNRLGEARRQVQSGKPVDWSSILKPPETRAQAPIDAGDTMPPG